MKSLKMFAALAALGAMSAPALSQDTSGSMGNKTSGVTTATMSKTTTKTGSSGVAKTSVKHRTTSHRTTSHRTTRHRTTRRHRAMKPMHHAGTMRSTTKTTASVKTTTKTP